MGKAGEMEVVFVPYSAKSVANYFLEKAWQSDGGVDPMKLQKLVYFAHGWNLGLFGEALIDEQVEAWPFGPVVPSLYHEFKVYGRNPITTQAMRYTGFSATPWPIPGDSRSTELLGRIWQVYKDASATKLSNITHKDGSPWSRVNEEYGGRIPKGTDIPRSYIEEHFRKLSESSAP